MTNPTYRDTINESPWVQDDPMGRLWSLWDMLRIYAHQYVSLGRQIEYASTIFAFSESAKEHGQEEPITEEERRDLMECLERLKHVCDEAELTVSAKVIARGLKDMPQTGRELQMLLGPVYEELKDRLFLFIPPHRARYYQENETIKGDVKTAFPEATSELMHAGNCYAAGEYTAAVFHSMRAAEIALRATAKDTGQLLKKGTLDSAEWHSLIELIDQHLKTLRNQPKTEQRDEEIKFYSDANSQFANFKDAFRKYVAHARESYEEIPSISILHRTREFIEILSKRVSE